MEMGGGDCNSGSSSAEGSSVLDRIMSKYRPIAPKPFTGGPLPNKLPRRTKRKYVRTARKNSGVQLVDGKHEMTTTPGKTLQLLPQMMEESGSEGFKHGGGSGFEVIPRVVEDSNHWLSLSGGGGDPTAEMGKNQQVESVPDPSAVMDKMGGVESWVTVECVRGTCMTAPTTSTQGFRFGLSGASADEERMRILENDTCPGFISDGWNRVRWLNGAFRRMVMMTRQQQPLPEVTVWLLMTEELPHTTNSVFTCQVKLKYTVVESRKKDKNYYSQLVPCDLWRIDGGGFAWRLDVKAALSLGGLTNQLRDIPDKIR